MKTWFRDPLASSTPIEPERGLVKSRTVGFPAGDSEERSRPYADGRDAVKWGGITIVA